MSKKENTLLYSAYPDEFNNKQNEMVKSPLGTPIADSRFGEASDVNAMMRKVIGSNYIGEEHDVHGSFSINNYNKGIFDVIRSNGMVYIFHKDGYLFYGTEDDVENNPSNLDVKFISVTSYRIELSKDNNGNVILWQYHGGSESLLYSKHDLKHGWIEGTISFLDNDLDYSYPSKVIFTDNVILLSFTSGHINKLMKVENGTVSEIVLREKLINFGYDSARDVIIYGTDNDRLKELKTGSFYDMIGPQSTPIELKTDNSHNVMASIAVVDNNIETLYIWSNSYGLCTSLDNGAHWTVGLEKEFGLKCNEDIHGMFLNPNTNTLYIHGNNILLRKTPGHDIQNIKNVVIVSEFDFRSVSVDKTHVYFASGNNNVVLAFNEVNSTVADSGFVMSSAPIHVLINNYNYHIGVNTATDKFVIYKGYKDEVPNLTENSNYVINREVVCIDKYNRIYFLVTLGTGNNELVIYNILTDRYYTRGIDDDVEMMKIVNDHLYITTDRIKDLRGYHIYESISNLPYIVSPAEFIYKSEDLNVGEFSINSIDISDTTFRLSTDSGLLTFKDSGEKILATSVSYHNELVYKVASKSDLYTTKGMKYSINHLNNLLDTSGKSVGYANNSTNHNMMIGNGSIGVDSINNGVLSRVKGYNNENVRTRIDSALVQGLEIEDSPYHNDESLDCLDFSYDGNIISYRSSFMNDMSFGDIMSRVCILDKDYNFLKYVDIKNIVLPDSGLCRLLEFRILSPGVMVMAIAPSVANVLTMNTRYYISDDNGSTWLQMIYTEDGETATYNHDLDSSENFNFHVGFTLFNNSIYYSGVTKTASHLLKYDINAQVVESVESNINLQNDCYDIHPAGIIDDKLCIQKIHYKKVTNISDTLTISTKYIDNEGIIDVFETAIPLEGVVATTNVVTIDNPMYRLSENIFVTSVRHLNNKFRTADNKSVTVLITYDKGRSWVPMLSSAIDCYTSSKYNYGLVIPQKNLTDVPNISVPFIEGGVGENVCGYLESPYCLRLLGDIDKSVKLDSPMNTDIKTFNSDNGLVGIYSTTPVFDEFVIITVRGYEINQTIFKSPFGKNCSIVDINCVDGIIGLVINHDDIVTAYDIREAGGEVVKFMNMDVKNIDKIFKDYKVLFNSRYLFIGRKVYDFSPEGIFRTSVHTFTSDIKYVTERFVMTADNKLYVNDNFHKPISIINMSEVGIIGAYEEFLYVYENKIDTTDLIIKKLDVVTGTIVPIMTKTSLEMAGALTMPGVDMTLKFDIATFNTDFIVLNVFSDDRIVFKINSAQGVLVTSGSNLVFCMEDAAVPNYLKLIKPMSEIVSSTLSVSINGEDNLLIHQTGNPKIIYQCSVSEDIVNRVELLSPIEIDDGIVLDETVYEVMSTDQELLLNCDGVKEKSVVASMLRISADEYNGSFSRIPNKDTFAFFGDSYTDNLNILDTSSGPGLIKIGAEGSMDYDKDGYTIINNSRTISDVQDILGSSWSIPKRYFDKGLQKFNIYMEFDSSYGDGIPSVILKTILYCNANDSPILMSAIPGTSILMGSLNLEGVTIPENEEILIYWQNHIGKYRVKMWAVASDNLSLIPCIKNKRGYISKDLNIDTDSGLLGIDIFFRLSKITHAGLTMKSSLLKIDESISVWLETTNGDNYTLKYKYDGIEHDMGTVPAFAETYTNFRYGILYDESQPNTVKHMFKFSLGNTISDIVDRAPGDVLSNLSTIEFFNEDKNSLNGFCDEIVITKNQYASELEDFASHGLLQTYGYSDMNCANLVSINGDTYAVCYFDLRFDSKNIGMSNGVRLIKIDNSVVSLASPGVITITDDSNKYYFNDLIPGNITFTMDENGTYFRAKVANRLSGEESNQILIKKSL